MKRKLVKLFLGIVIIFPFFLINDSAEAIVYDDITSANQETQTAISWLDSQKITQGYEDLDGDGHTIFGLRDSLTRSQMVTFLYRMEGSPAVTIKTKFTDISSFGTEFKNAIAWAYSEKITTGYTETIFAPNDPVSREQMAAFLHRLAGNPTASTTNQFVDVDKKNQFSSSIDWLSETGITTGYTPTTFVPKAVVLREQMALFLKRYHDYSTNSDPVSQFALTGQAYDSDGKLISEGELKLTNQKNSNSETLISTDKEGYLFTHVLSGSKYTLNGEKFEITIKVNGLNDFEVINKKGTFKLGLKETTDSGTLVLEPSAIKLNDEVFDFSVSDDFKVLTIDSESDLRVGDVVYLEAQAHYPGGLGLKITSIDTINGEIIANVNAAELDEIATEIKGEAENIPITQAYFVPAEGVDVAQQNLRAKNYTGGVSAELSFNKGALNGSAKLSVEGSLDAKVDINPILLQESTFIIKNGLSIKLDGNLSLSGEIEAFKQNIGTIYVPTGIPAVSANFPLDVVISAKGEISVEVGVNANLSLDVGYDRGNIIATEENKIDTDLSVKGDLTLKAGIEGSVSLTAFTQIEALKLSLGTGGKANTSISMTTPSPSFEPLLKLTGKVKAYGDIKYSFPILQQIKGFENEFKLLELELDLYEINLDFPLTDSDYEDYQKLNFTTFKQTLTLGNEIIVDNAEMYQDDSDYQKLKSVLDGSDPLLRGFSATELIDLINQGTPFNDKNGKRYFVDQQHVNLVDDAIVGLIDAFKKNNGIDNEQWDFIIGDMIDINSPRLMKLSTTISGVKLLKEPYGLENSSSVYNMYFEFEKLMNYAGKPTQEFSLLEKNQDNSEEYSPRRSYKLTVNEPITCQINDSGNVQALYQIPFLDERLAWDSTMVYNAPEGEWNGVDSPLYPGQTFYGIPKDEGEYTVYVLGTTSQEFSAWYTVQPINIKYKDITAPIIDMDNLTFNSSQLYGNISADATITIETSTGITETSGGASWFYFEFDNSRNIYPGDYVKISAEDKVGNKIQPFWLLMGKDNEWSKIDDEILLPKK